MRFYELDRSKKKQVELHHQPLPTQNKFPRLVVTLQFKSIVIGYQMYKPKILEIQHGIESVV